MFPISIPPLRERPEDIPLLVRHFVQQFARRMNKNIEATFETMEALTRYGWPGNIRELQNVIERAVVVYEKGKLSVKKSWLSREYFHTEPATQPVFKRSAHPGSRNDWRCLGRNERPSVGTVGCGCQAWYSAIHLGIEDQIDEYQQV